MKNIKNGRKKIVFSAKDTYITMFISVFTLTFCLIIKALDEGMAYVSMVFLFAVFLVSRLTEGYFYGILASFMSVFCVNYVFTYPYMKFNFTMSGYPMTFVTMMIVSAVTSAMTSGLKEKEQLKAEAEKERIRGNLLRAVSHDLRTPLTAIIGSGEWLAENAESAEPCEVKRMARGIESDASWLLRMVENLLSITKIEASGANLKLRPEIIEEIIGSAAAKFKKWHSCAELTVKTDEELLIADMDGVLIEQVILNFLDNAVKHSCGADKICLELIKNGESAEVRVSDNGKGIDPEKLPDIFSGVKKEKAESSDGHRNMGIGLSVCKTIIKAHGGRIFAGNRPEGGAVFGFILPLTEVNTDDE